MIKIKEQNVVVLLPIELLLNVAYRNLWPTQSQYAERWFRFFNEQKYGLSWL